MLPVIFRKYPVTQGGDIIALFPTNAGNIDETTCSSYQHVGQHGHADYAGTMLNTTEAVREEYKPLLQELRSIGYRGLKDGLRVYSMKRSKDKLETSWLKVRRKQIQS